MPMSAYAKYYFNIVLNIQMWKVLKKYLLIEEWKEGSKKVYSFFPPNVR